MRNDWIIFFFGDRNKIKRSENGEELEEKEEWEWMSGCDSNDRKKNYVFFLSIDRSTINKEFPFQTKFSLSLYDFDPSNISINY